MSKIRKEFNIKAQMHRLLMISGLRSFQLAGASWVVLLAARGFTLVEIGLAESCFHIASLLFEIPSGVIADVFGRKKSMVASQVMAALAALCMVLTRSLAGVCAALVLDAWGYNFASGTQEALAYDSLKAVGHADRYMEFSTRELSIYRMGDAAAILCAGLALWMGHRAAYLLDMALALLGVYLSFGLQEDRLPAPRRERILSRIAHCFAESLRFMRGNLSSLGVMLAAALPSAIATLAAFFLQARLENTQLSSAMLGPALFLVSMGGALGARCAKRFSACRYWCVCVFCTAGIAAGVLGCLTNRVVCMCAGGFAAKMFSDVLDLCCDAMLNVRFPSEQRSTLLSMASLLFSLVMIALSPLAGWIFQG